MKYIKQIFRKEGAFAAAIFVDSKLSVDIFDEQHLIYKMKIKGLWRPKPVLFQADSFLFVKDDELFLFYEMQHWDAPGVIAMVKTKDLRNWTRPVVVLRQPFHLSFPYVFEDKGCVYMIPESQENDAIHLFKAVNDDLTLFTKVRTLLHQQRIGGIHYNYNDSHIYKKNGKYYLFTSFQKDWMYYQELYMTDDLLSGEFIKHPQSPICVSNEYGRNGGSLIDFDGHLLRVTQDCHAAYGDNVSLMEIDILTPSQYQEHLFRRNIFPKNSIFVDGGHQLNIVRLKNKYVYATDYKKNSWSWYKLFIAILIKLRLHKNRS